MKKRAGIHRIEEIVQQNFSGWMAPRNLVGGDRQQRYET